MDRQIPTGPVEIAENVYWVGSLGEHRGLDCNPYLIMEEGRGTLIDPGSVLDFEIVKANVESLLPLEKIRYIILHHQDPDLCSSTPLFEKAGFRGEVVTHWRTSLIIQYYGIRSPFYTINENGYALKLSESRRLEFIPAPYMHFPGAVMTFDPKENILFSGDVFGAVSHKRTLFADETYVEPFKIFHESYMPSNQIIRPVMETLLFYPINMIAPQHGSVIRGREESERYIKILRKLECGVFLAGTKKELVKAGNYAGICNQVLDRYYSVYSREEVTALFEGTGITLDAESGMIVDYTSTGDQLWNNLFQIIFEKKGTKWFPIIESLVQQIVAEYDLEIPEALGSVIVSNEQQIQRMDSENRRLIEETRRMQSQIQDITDQLMKCPLTGLYNERFFFEWLTSWFDGKEQAFSALFFLVDDILPYGQRYGTEAADEVVRGIAYLISNYLHDDKVCSNCLLVKLNAPGFAFTVSGISPERSTKIANAVRTAVEASEIFLQTVTVSVGIISSDDPLLTADSAGARVRSLVHNGQFRAEHVKKSGGNSICDYQPENTQRKTKGKTVLIEPEELLRESIKSALNARDFEVITSDLGEEGLALVERETPDLIICAQHLPQMDGFILKQSLNASARLASIPFLMISGHKTAEAIRRAAALNIRHFFTKPVSMDEIAGLAENYIKYGSDQ